MDNNIEKNKVKDEVVMNKDVVKKNKRVLVNNTKRDNNGVGIVLVVSILLSFVCGAIGAYLIVSNYTLEQVVKTITTSELVENSISSSVDKVYSSTVIIVSYKKGSQISTGTGFVYKKRIL